jgi:hypothetical protein
VQFERVAGRCRKEGSFELETRTDLLGFAAGLAVQSLEWGPKRGAINAEGIRGRILWMPSQGIDGMTQR